MSLSGSTGEKNRAPGPGTVKVLALGYQSLTGLFETMGGGLKSIRKRVRGRPSVPGCLSLRAIANRDHKSTHKDDHKSPVRKWGFVIQVNHCWLVHADHPLGAFYEREFEPLLLPEALIESG